MTLAAWSVEWLAGLRVRASTEDAYRYAVQRIVADLGTRPLTALRSSEVKTWRKSLDDRYAATTAARTATVLAMMLRAAVEDGLIPKSPVSEVRTKGAGRLVDPDELLTVEQVRAWGAAMPPYAREMPLLAAMTGLRQGELLGLRLPNVDFLRREVRVVEQLITPEKGPPTWGPPKTAAGVRSVPLPDEALEALARHVAAYPPPDGEPIFRTMHGHRWRRNTFGDVFRKASRAADLPAYAHWHGLRDIFCSMLLAQGVDMQSIVVVGGWSSMAQLKPYARLVPDSRDNVRAGIAAAWRDESRSRETS